MVVRKGNCLIEITDDTRERLKEFSKKMSLRNYSACITFLLNNQKLLEMTIAKRLNEE